MLGSLGKQKKLLCDSCPVIRKVSRWGERITRWSLLGDACRLRAQGCNIYCIECVLVFSHHPCLARQLTSPDGRSFFCTFVFQSVQHFVYYLNYLKLYIIIKHVAGSGIKTSQELRKLPFTSLDVRSVCPVYHLLLVCPVCPVS